MSRLWPSRPRWPRFWRPRFRRPGCWRSRLWPPRLWWGPIDQGLAGLTGAAVIVQGAAGLTPVEFGRLSAALAGYYFLLTALRAMVGEVYLARFADVADRLPPGTQRWAQLTTLQLSGAVAVALLAAVATPLPMATRQLLAAAAVAVPLLLWHEVRRAVLLAAGRPARAAASGALVLSGQATGGIALWLAGQVSGPALLLCWAAGAALAIGCVPGADWRRVPGRSGSWRWLAEGRAYWPRLLCQDMSRGGASQAALLLAAAAAGTIVLAGVRAAVLLLAPLAMLQRAVAGRAMAEATRGRPAGHWRLVVLRQLGVIAAGAVWLTALALAPRPALAVLVGANLPAGFAALPGMAMFTVGALLVAVPVAALRGTGQVRAGTALGIALMPVLLAAPTLITIRAGTPAEVAGVLGVFGVLSAAAWTAAGASLLRPGRWSAYQARLDGPDGPDTLDGPDAPADPLPGLIGGTHAG